MYQKPKWQLRTANAVFVVLFFVAIGLLQWASREFHWRVDVTQNRLYSLSPASIAAVERIQGPVTVAAYVNKRGDAQQVIRDVLARYQQYKPDIALELIDPDTDPTRTREAGIQDPNGELRIRHGEMTENIPVSALTEENLTSAFTRLGHSGERWLVFLSGHGERSPDGLANFDLSTWAAQLRKRGFKTRALALSESSHIPENTSVLVVAGPRARLLAGDLKVIENYVKRGGNLLWLADPGPLQGLERVAELIGVELQPGVVLDPISEFRANDRTAVIISRYGSHPVVRDFIYETVFLRAAALSVRPPEGWKSQALLDTRQGAWSETGSLDGDARYDKGKDIPGPLTLGVALTRSVEGREQRVVVIGDGDFLSNSVIANGGNLELGMSIANWLSQDDAYVNIPVRTARDRGLSLSNTMQVVLGAGFFIGLPLAFLATGVTIWWRRRRR